MQQKVQSFGSSPQSCQASSMGKLPVNQKTIGTVPNDLDSTPGDNECQAAASNGRVNKVAVEEKSIFTGVGITSGVLIATVRLYQLLISPWKPQCCRFTPSCSNYAIEVIRAHGVFTGTRLALWRILRCQPFCHGGHDPVPQRPEKPPECQCFNAGKKERS